MSTVVRTTLVPLNPTVGDLAGNASAIQLAAQLAAADHSADLIIFPELALTGYPPKDLLLQEDFVPRCVQWCRVIASQVPPTSTVIFGTPWPASVSSLGSSDRAEASGQHNSLVACRGGAIVAIYHKRLLPTYDVFDEDRYFEPGDAPLRLEIPLRSGGAALIGLSICEDLWHGRDAGAAQRYNNSPDPVEELMRPDATGRRPDLIVNPSASPFVLGKAALQVEILRHHALRHRVPVLAVNQFGANDELIFSGGAHAVGPDGTVFAVNQTFTGNPLHTLAPVQGQTVASMPHHIGDGHPAAPAAAGQGRGAAVAQDTADLFCALVLGIRDYCRKTGFRSAVLGLSGGIDSAVVAVLAAAALGPANVLGASMPSRYSSDGSKTDAQALASNLGIKLHTLPIEDAFIQVQSLVAPVFEGRPADATEENLQSRLRGTVLMALSNKFNHLLLTTGNKSEMAVGYCTLYGDMNGGLAVLSDVTKRWVYALANWMNANFTALGIAGLSKPPIPEASITKPPSAELRPNQTDQDTLPPYDLLDEVVHRYIELHQSPEHIVADTGFDPAIVAKLRRMIDLAEFKRKQAAIGLKVTSVAFGSGRRMPIAQRYGALAAPPAFVQSATQSRHQSPTPDASR